MKQKGREQKFYTKRYLNESTVEMILKIISYFRKTSGVYQKK